MDIIFIYDNFSSYHCPQCGTIITMDTTNPNDWNFCCLCDHIVDHDNTVILVYDKENDVYIEQ